MPRIVWRSFNRGLWLAGGPDSIPDDALRRATGIDQVKEGVIRAARGTTIVNLHGANQLVRFSDDLYQGQAEFVRRNDIVVNATQDGTRLSFLRAPVGPGLDDYLFVAGGGHLIKIKDDGTVSEWGIEPPADGAEAAELAPIKNNTIDAMNDDSGWALTPDSSGTLTDSLADGDSPVVHSTDNTNALKLISSDAPLTQIVKSVTIDLNRFNLSAFADSFDQDYIEWWVRIDDIDELSRLELAFSLGDSDFDDDFYVRRIEKNDLAPPDLVEESGIASDLTEEEERFLVSGRPGTQVRNVNALAKDKIAKRSTSWIQLKMPKNSFDRSGDDDSLNWSDVQAVRVSLVKVGTSSRNVTLWAGSLRLRGGYGLIGVYKYFFTFKNSVTGNRSNPNPTPVTVRSKDGTGAVNRQGIGLTDLPVSTDPQVDQLEIWRTLGNGELYFLADTIDNGDTTYTDEIVDFRQLASGDHIAEVDLPATLDIEELPIDNAVPLDEFDHVASETRVGRAWWCGDGQDKVYYSAAGRPESLDGFVNCANTDDPPMMSIVWSDAVYAFTKRRVFRITGEDEPFLAEEVFGVPGATEFDTVVATPFGIIYQAVDGVRVFNGTTSELAAIEAVGPVFRGRDVENVTAFEGISATYAKDAYYICDSTQVLVLDLRTGVWRHFAVAADTLYAEGDNTDILMAIGLDVGLVATLEDENANAPTPFEVQTYAQRTGVDMPGFVRRIYFDIDTQGVDVFPTLFVDDQVIALPELNTNSRQMLEYTVFVSGKLIAVNLLAAVSTEELQLYGIECDVYVPEGSDDRSIRPRSEQ